MSTEYYPRTSLIGGGAGALDQLASADLDTDDVAYVTTSTTFYVYHYDGTSAAGESSPNIIAPDDIGVGNGRWILVFSAVTFAAQSVLAATAVGIPAALTIAEDRLVGRIVAGNVAALTPAQVMAMLSGEAGAAFDFGSQALTSVGTIGCGTVTTTGDYLLANGNYVGISAAERLEFYTAGYAAFMGCNLGVGIATPADFVHFKKAGNPRMYLEDPADANANFILTFVKSRADGIITTGDYLGRLTFQGHDGGDFLTIGGEIRVVTEGTIGVNRIPAYMSFLTHGDAAGVATEAMRIDSGQNVGIGTTSPDSLLDVESSRDDAYLARIYNTHAGGSGLYIRAGDTSSETILRLDDVNGAMKFAFYGDGTTFGLSPDIKKDWGIKNPTPNDYLTWALEDAKKPNLPRKGSQDSEEEKQHATISEKDIIKKYGKDYVKMSIGVTRWAEEARERIYNLEAEVKKLKAKFN